MASTPVVLQRLRRIRRERVPEEGSFTTYESDYRELLTAIEEAGGEEALDDVAAWAVEWTEAERRLPPPDVLREHARELLEERGIDRPPTLQSR